MSGAIGFRNRLVLLVVGLYLLLSYGFMQVRVPPVAGGGIPIGEVILLLALATINLPVILSRLSELSPLTPFFIWWGLGLSRAIFGVSQYGLWALRDATHVIESLFLLVGFAMVGQREVLAHFFNRWLPRLLLLGCIYALGYPYGEVLQPFSPQLIAGAGHQVPLFFTYNTLHILLLMSATYLVLYQKPLQFIPPLLIAYPLLFFQARTVYLQIIALFALFFLYHRHLFSKMMALLILGLIGLLLIPILGLEVTGRLGQPVSFEFLLKHIPTIVGVASEGVEAAADGFYLRIGWWLGLYERWTSDLTSILFGLGYGIPLTDFHAHGGVTVREPHNSYISILARLGLVGAMAWTWMHWQLLRVWRQAYRRCHEMAWRAGKNHVLILMTFFILILFNAIGEDAFEKPYFAIPYYFFWGVMLRFYYHLRNEALESEPVEMNPERGV